MDWQKSALIIRKYFFLLQISEISEFTWAPLHVENFCDANLIYFKIPWKVIFMWKTELLKIGKVTFIQTLAV